VEHGHEQIHDDDVRTQLLHQVERLAAVAGLADHLEVAFQPEGEPQALPHHRVIVYEQDSNYGHDVSAPRLPPRPGPERQTLGGEARAPSGRPAARLPPLRT